MGLKRIFVLFFSFLSIWAKSQHLYYNGHIYTVDSVFSMADYMLVDSNGKVARLGKGLPPSNLLKKNKITDLKGKYIYPGFIDAHCHFMGLGLSMNMADLTGCNSVEDVILACTEFRKKNPKVPFLLGRGWDQNKFPGKDFPDHTALTQAFPDIPVVLKRIDGHAAWCNRKMMELAGITQSMPVNGGEILTQNGIPSGIFIDNAVDLVMSKIPPLQLNEILKYCQDAERKCVSVGLTTVVDAGLELDTLLIIQKIYELNKLNIRFSGMYSAGPKSYKYISTMHDLGIPQSLQSKFNIQGIKLYADGALGSRGACLKQPYSDRENHSGYMLNQSENIQLAAMVAFSHGLQLNVHAIGDSAIKEVIKVFSFYTALNPSLRWRIEHAQVTDSSDISLFGKYYIIPSVQPVHATSDMYWAENRLGKNRIAHAYAYKRLLEQNGWMPLGTDFPVERPDPILNFYAAVSRKDTSGNPQEGFFGSEKLSRREALQGITLFAAKSIFEENSRGSLEPGKWADFVILDEDLINIPENRIYKTKVLATYIAGKKLYGL